MSNVGTVLREEIKRLSRKEIRSQVDPTKKFAAQHRRDIAALKRQETQLERHVTLLSRKVVGKRMEVLPDTVAKPVLFSARRLHSQRNRLGLSAIDFGRLLSVSAQTIYNWEHEVTRPRSEQLGKLAALRGIGKREVAARLEQLVATNGKTRHKT